MSYLVLARKWRPQSFDEIVGQAHVSQTLMNAIRSDRVAHAFLFTGVRGVGKTQTLATGVPAGKTPVTVAPEQVTRVQIAVEVEVVVATV